MSATTARSMEAPSPHHWTLDEYHCAIDAGVLGDARVELLHGEVIVMTKLDATIDKNGWTACHSEATGRGCFRSSGVARPRMILMPSAAMSSSSRRLRPGAYAARSRGMWSC